MLVAVVALSYQLYHSVTGVFQMNEGVKDLLLPKFEHELAQTCRVRERSMRRVVKTFTRGIGQL